MSLSAAKRRQSDPEAEHDRAMERELARKPFNEEGQLTAEYLRELTDTNLEDGTVNVLQNLVTKDFVLGYLEEAEVTEQKWLARTAAMRVYAMHPGEHCVIRGDYRAELYGDDDEKLMPLSDQQKETIRSFIKGVFMRVTRSKEGWQQEKVGEQVQVQRREDQQSESGGWLNIFS